ncbi:MAG: transcriptional regulator [Phenylobacterium sp.]|uniref:transcriptional regulator n=1 Tax=Phenylobacterium sp. TaxID=1871053 RepID=UPI002736621B|nr:transcriptional regulator [Phenylobacterium sp.]MDP3173116.1 transcriptional regulator [Phenylobacterium sp.]
MTQTHDLIPAWTPAQAKAFRKAPVKFAHRMAESGLFEDDALADLLDRYPAELFDINLFDFDEDGQMRMRTGARGDLPGKEILKGVKAGRVWVQLRGAEQHQAGLKDLIEDAFAQIAANAPGFKPVQLNGQLIISAPQAKVPFHADAPGVVLFHIRGAKRIWIYPADERHVPQRSMEDIMLKAQTEDLPYRREMDAEAEVLDLAAGEAVSWPLHAPHRVENLGEFSVSLSVDYQTWPSRIVNGAHYANGVLRRAGVPVARMSRTPVLARVGLWAAALGLRRTNLVADKIHNLERTFELDGKPILAEPQGVRR